MSLKLNSYQQRIQVLDSSFKALNPKQVLSRGFSYLQTKENKVIKNINEFDRLKTDEKISIHFSDGERNVRKIG
jgi:exonuclease VII large subunit